jgi:P22 coat protein - gene protein 5
MANTLLTISMITRESARVLVNNLGFAKKVNREYDDQFAVKGAKIGNTLNIRKPPRYIGRTGDALAIEDATETSVPLVLTTKFGVDLAFSITDLVLSIDDFSKRFINPAIAKIANKIDFDGTLLYQTVYNTIGTPGAVPNQALIYLQVNQRLSEEAAPFESRSICITPAMNATIVDALKGLFQASDKIREQYNKGIMGVGLGYEGWYLDQNLRTHTVGPLGGSPVVNGAAQTGSNLITNGWTAAAANRLKKGDVFTIAGVNAVNPQNQQDTGALRQFVVTADVNSDGAGNATIPISPAITVTGPFATVTASPANAAAITVLGAANTKTPQGLAFHPDAFTLGMADLLLPRGVHAADRVSDKQLGVSIRLVEAYDINQDRLPCRTDVLYGYAPVYPELACRLAS